MRHMRTAQEEIRSGDRFAFGANWQAFLDTVTEDKIDRSRQALADFLDTDDLSGKTFLDVGSGSGLSSLAARRMGARVVSFDFDPESVACTRELRRRYDSEAQWQVEQGSALDSAFIATLGTFDVVYSWGVLHHTGSMWAALDLIDRLVAPDGTLFLAIYNDQGRASRIWRRVKQVYNKSGPMVRRAVLTGARLHFWRKEHDVLAWAYRVVKRLPRQAPPAARGRGMDKQRDLVDWVGGYPFEVAKPEEIFDFYRARNYTLQRLQTCAGGLGCNQFVFRRSARTPQESHTHRP